VSDLNQRAIERVKEFGERVITEELGGAEYAADAGAIAWVIDYIQELQDRITELESALMPFAKYYDKMIDEEADFAALTKAEFVRAFNTMSN
jgi:hypothetical protein